MENRHAVVTGAGRGVGRLVAERLAQQGVLLTAIDVDGEAARQTAEQVNGQAFQVDASDYWGLADAFDAAVRENGPVDVLVNSAGLLSTTSLANLAHDEWHRALAVNLNSVFYCSQLVFRTMQSRNWGRIVSVASIAGKRGGGFIGGIAYSTAKAAVIGFTKAAAREAAPFGVTVNAVAPGLLETAMTEHYLRDPETRARLFAAIPVGRPGTADEVAAAVVFLASEEAAYITGETLNIDGGVAME